MAKTKEQQVLDAAQARLDRTKAEAKAGRGRPLEVAFAAVDRNAARNSVEYHR